jgi:hypothetical protein
MLDGWFFIDSWHSDAERLVVRLVPDHFQPGLTDPVVTIVIIDLQDAAVSESALQLRKHDCIVDLQLSEGLAALWGEADDEPASLRGSSVSVSRGSYSVSDFERIIRHKDQQLERCYAQVRELGLTVQRTEHFVFELIRRAEAKRQLTSRDPAALDLELDVLRRVLHRIQEP